MRPLLTPKQQYVLDRLCDGQTRTEIAQRMRTSAKAVDVLIRRLKNKACNGPGPMTLVGLVKWAEGRGIAKAVPAPDDPTKMSLSDLLDHRNNLQSELILVENHITAWLIAAAIRCQPGEAPAVSEIIDQKLLIIAERNGCNGAIA